MNEPRNIMRDELLNKLRYEPGSLSAEERRLIAADSELARELELSQVLDASAFGEPSAPPVDTQISAAINLLADDEKTREDQGFLRSWLVGKKWYWQVAAVGAAIMLVFLTAALWPWRVNVTSNGIDVVKKMAWATVNGYLVEFTIEFDELYTGTAIDSPQHSLRKAQTLVDNWVDKHLNTDTTGTAGTLAELSIERGWKQGYRDLEYQYLVSIEVMTADRDQVDQLVDQLSEIRNLSQLAVYNQEWFYIEKYPETRYIGREISINDKIYYYPRDIDEAALSFIGMALNIDPDHAGQLYYALDDIPEFRRYGFSDIVIMSWEAEGRVNIENTDYELDFSDLGLPAWLHMQSMHVPAGETHLELDIVDLMIRHAQKQRKSAFTALNSQGRRLIVDLLPRHRWSGMGELELSGEFSAPELTAAELLADSSEAAYAELLVDYPEAKKFLSTEVVRRGGIPLQWTIDVTDCPPTALAHLVKAYVAEYSDAALRIVPILPEPGEFPIGAVVKTSFTPRLNHPSPDNQLSAVVPVLGIRFFAPERFRGMAQEDLLSEFSVADFESGARLTAAIDMALDVFKATRQDAHSDGQYSNVMAGLPLKYGDLSVGYSIQLLGVHPDFLAELYKALAAAGLPGRDEAESWFYELYQPRIEDILQQHETEQDIFRTMLWYDLPYTKRSTVCAREYLPQIYTQEEKEWAVELLGRMQTALDLWLVDQLDDVEASLVVKEQSGLIHQIYVNCNSSDVETVKSLAQALAVEGAPTYNYGVAFKNRNNPMELRIAPQRRDVKTTMIGYMLLSQVRWSAAMSGGNGQAAVDEEFTADEIAQACETGENIKRIFDKWLTQRPELKELIVDEPGAAVSQAQFRENNIGGILLSVFVDIRELDEKHAHKLAEEFIALVSAAGIEIKPFTSRVTEPVILSSHETKTAGDGEENLQELLQVLKEHTRTQVSWNVLPQVRWRAVSREGDYEVNLHKEFSTEEIEQARLAGKTIARVYHEWLKKHPELEKPVEPGLSVMKTDLSLLQTGDVLRVVSVKLIADDNDNARALFKELEAMVSAAGVDVKFITNLQMQGS